MDVGTLCSRPARTIDAGATARDASIRMLEHHVGTLVVVDASDEPVGLVTDRDLVMRCLAREFDPDTMRVSEIMSEPLESVLAETAPDEAFKVMADSEVRRLAVRDWDERVVGVLSLDDLLKYLVQETGELGRLIKSQVHA